MTRIDIGDGAHVETKGWHFRWVEAHTVLMQTMDDDRRAEMGAMPEYSEAMGDLLNCGLLSTGDDPLPPRLFGDMRWSKVLRANAAGLAGCLARCRHCQAERLWSGPMDTPWVQARCNSETCLRRQHIERLQTDYRKACADEAALMTYLERPCVRDWARRLYTQGSADGYQGRGDDGSIDPAINLMESMGWIEAYELVEEGEQKRRYEAARRKQATPIGPTWAVSQQIGLPSQKWWKVGEHPAFGAWVRDLTAKMDKSYTL